MSPTCFLTVGPSGCGGWRRVSGASGLQGSRSGSYCWIEGCWGPAGNPSLLQKYKADRKAAQNKGYVLFCNFIQQIPTHYETNITSINN